MEIEAMDLWDQRSRSRLCPQLRVGKLTCWVKTRDCSRSRKSEADLQYMLSIKKVNKKEDRG